jgi:hypothetical protein
MFEIIPLGINGIVIPKPLPHRHFLLKSELNNIDKTLHILEFIKFQKKEVISM